MSYLLISGDHPFPMKPGIRARSRGRGRGRPAGLSNRQWQALRAALQWKREQRPADVQEWLRQMDLRGAAKRSAPLTDHLEPPLHKESRSGLATVIAAGVVLLLAGAYWILSHRATLPRVDSTAQVRVPDTPARPSASPPPARIPAPASQDAPAAAPPVAGRPGAATPLAA